MAFERNIKSYGLGVKVSDNVKEFLKANEDIVAIPGKECLEFYYDGKPIGSVKNGQWKKFSSSYNDAVREKGLPEDFFKKQDEFDIASESREFGYYLLLKDPKFKCVIKSLTNAPKNEIDIYTQKFNIASDLLNNGMYIKEDIKNGKSLEIYEYMNKKFSIIYLEFYVEDNKEITLTVYKRGVEENNFNQIGFNNIIKTVKNENNKENINDEYKIAKIIIINTSSSFNDVDNESSYKNEFKIVFDNFDSWFTNRIIHYSISTFEISD